MIVEIAPFSEALVTLRALQFPSRMRLQMKFQASPIRKASFTLIALERLLSGVKPHVILKGFDEWENPSAQVAFEGFFLWSDFCYASQSGSFYGKSFHTRDIKRFSLE